VDGGLLAREITGLFRLLQIQRKSFAGENWQESFRSPLTEPGVKAKVGDFILSVDGRSTRGVKNFYELLEGKGDRVVTLQAQRPSGRGGRARGARASRQE